VYPGQKTGPDYVFPSVGRRHLTMLLALAAIWGSSFMFIKVAVRELEPGVVVFGRVFVATLTLLPAVHFMIGWRRLFTELRRFARPLVVLALFNASIPFWLLAWGEERLDSGLAAVLQASTPLFTALLAFGFSRSDRIGGTRLIGVVVKSTNSTALHGRASVEKIAIGALPDKNYAEFYERFCGLNP